VVGVRHEWKGQIVPLGEPLVAGVVVRRDADDRDVVVVQKLEVVAQIARLGGTPAPPSDLSTRRDRRLLRCGSSP
jgi:hypothetical protein